MTAFTVPESLKELAVNASTAITASVAGISWVAPLNEVLQLGVTALALVTGVLAARWYIYRTKLAKQELAKQEQDG